MDRYLGADDYITKPFTRQELLRAVQTRLEKKAAQERVHQDEVEQWQQAFKQEREQRQLKSKLVAMFSHDFRNPLASIMSSNSLLRDYYDRMDEGRRLVHFNRIDASVRQLIQMLDDMLVVAQMENGSLSLEPEMLDLGEFVQRIVEEFQALRGETHSLIFECYLSDRVPADPRLVRQIGTNLISNAIKYSPHGSEIQVSLERTNEQVILTVRDHGIGIPENEREHLFEAFQRASNVRDISGTGLGLAIVKQAVDLHGGLVSVESELGKGTIVRVEFPAE